MSEEKMEQEERQDKNAVFSQFPIPSYIGMVSGKYGVFTYNKNDEIIGRSIEKYGEFCSRQVDLILQLISPGDLVIDVGANIGTYAIPCANKVTTSGIVLAFEPQRLIYNNLCANVFLNGIQNLKCYHQGVGAEHSSVRLPVLDPEKKLNFGGVNIKGFPSGEKVEIITLDSLEINRCTLIKIDVVGMEAEVLEGGKKLIDRFRPLLYVEASQLEGMDRLLKIFQDLNYRCCWMYEHYYNPNNYFGEEENVFVPGLTDVNLLCYPSENPIRISGLEPVVGIDDNWKKAQERRRARALNF